jgi:cellobiose phosphorylase
MVKDVTEYLLGVRAAFEGLVVDPCVPTGWKKFQVQCKFRGATYRIDVSIPKGKGGQVLEIVANGTKVEGTAFPAAPGGETVNVKVKVG